MPQPPPNGDNKRNCDVFEVDAVGIAVGASVGVGMVVGVYVGLGVGVVNGVTVRVGVGCVVAVGLGVYVLVGSGVAVGTAVEVDAGIIVDADSVGKDVGATCLPGSLNKRMPPITTATSVATPTTHFQDDIICALISSVKLARVASGMVF